jgi:hypothetical protein
MDASRYFLDVASTPPSQGGECRRRKSRREFIHSFYDRAVFLELLEYVAVIDRAYSAFCGYF